jgi:signal transduction histidine kinase
MNLADDNATTTGLAIETHATAANAEPPVRYARCVSRAAYKQPPPDTQRGVSFCRQVWERIQAMDPRIFLTLPFAVQAGGDDAGSVPLYGAKCPAHAYTDVAHEVERALQDGIRPATALALVMLAAIAAEHEDGAEPAVRLAQVALDMADRDGGPHAAQVRVLHAALVLPLTGKPHDAARSLVLLSQSGSAAHLAAVSLAGVGFVSGMMLSMLSQHLDAAQQCRADHDASDATDGTAIELASKALLLRRLLDPKFAPTVRDLALASTANQEERFGHWLTRLQTAWYAGHHAAACHAASRATGLLSLLTPAAERLAWHTFAALAWSRSPETSAMEGIRRHAAALRRLAFGNPSMCNAMATLADAACERRRGNAEAALRGFEAAAAGAIEHGLHWLAALAWEEAALQSGESGFASAARHYQREALASYRQWGALGRIDYLQRAWNVADGSTSDELTGHATAGHGAPIAAGEFGLSIAHEVNQPLAAITLHAAAARKWLRRPEPDIERALASLSLISAAGRQAGGIVRSVQRLATHQEIDMGDVRVDEAITEALQLLDRRLNKHAIDVDLALGLGGLVIRANRVQLQQVVTNLVVNAIEAFADDHVLPFQRRIRIDSRIGSDRHIEIAVADNGPGIKPADRDRVFGSLFSTKPGNTGMGLSISLAIVRAHGGHIEFEPCAPHGTCFRFRLPVDGKSGTTTPSA